MIRGSVRPPPDEHAPFFARYIEQVPDGDVVALADSAGAAMLRLLHGIGETGAAHRYAPGKWSIKQVVAHVVDTERIMVYRALCIARGDPTPLPGFDENAYAAESAADERSLAELAAEFAAVRRATSLFLRGLPDEAWTRCGTASGAGISVRAIAWIIAGHELHHRSLLQSRYLPGLAGAAAQRGSEPPRPSSPH